jgi:hypothetical protein
MIERAPHLRRLSLLLAEFPVVGLLGARQVGKTTLAQQVAARVESPVTVFDLESPRDLARLQDPLFALESLEGLVILDEIQQRPDLFPTPRVLADRPETPAQFLVLGSASPLTREFSRVRTPWSIQPIGFGTARTAWSD